MVLGVEVSASIDQPPPLRTVAMPKSACFSFSSFSRHLTAYIRVTSLVLFGKYCGNVNQREVDDINCKVGWRGFFTLVVPRYLMVLLPFTQESREALWDH